MATTPSGTYGQLRVEANIPFQNAAARWSDVSWALYLDELGGPNLSWGSGIPASVVVEQAGVAFSAGVAFDWRPAGLQSNLLASGLTRIYHDTDGIFRGGVTPGVVAVICNIDYMGSAGAGGPTQVIIYLFTPDLKVLPGTPTSVVGTYVSDTQVNLTWAHSSATNGQPVTNKIQKRVNGGAWADLVTISATTSATVSVTANTKNEFRILNTNAAGDTPYSAISAPVYTTPAAPSSVVATKTGSDIVITFAENVAYSEYEHEVWHGTITGGVTTWDGAALTTLASADLDYTHSAPNPALVHVYRVRAKAGARLSGYVTSNSVQLLAPPAKPTVPALAAFANKAAVFRLPWVHNPVDSSAQTKYQWRWSSNGGSSWTTGAKTTSANPYHDFAASTWTANQSITFQVRTKGTYDSGSDGDASYSPWSDSVVVVFKTIPVATITSPANASVYTESVFKATVGFSQAEGATYVKSQLELIQSAVVLEAIESTLLVGITFATPVANGGSYSVRARVQDSNGLWSNWVTNTFTVTFLAPVPAVVTTTYLPDTGWGQLDLTIAAPGGGQAAASTVTITRTIDGVEEVVVKDYPVASPMTFLDTVPTIHGTNIYKVTTKSAIGAQSTTVAQLITAELRRAFLSKSAGFATVVCFGGNLAVSESLSVASDTFPAAGRTKPIGQYGVETSVQLKVSSTIIDGFGSTKEQARDAMLITGKACYRGPDGRRIFGSAKGGVSYKAGAPLKSAVLSFTLTETS